MADYMVSVNAFESGFR